MSSRKLALVVVLLPLAMNVLVLSGCSKKVTPMPSVQVPSASEPMTATAKGDAPTSGNVQTQQEGNATPTVTNDGGATATQVGTGKIKETDLGIAWYPGATVATQGMAASSTGKVIGQKSSVLLKTKDPVAKVAKFYKDRYAKGNTVTELEGSLMITIQSGDNRGKMIVVGPWDAKTTSISIADPSAVLGGT